METVPAWWGLPDSGGLLDYKKQVQASMLNCVFSSVNGKTHLVLACLRELWAQSGSYLKTQFLLMPNNVFKAAKGIRVI